MLKPHSQLMAVLGLRYIRGTAALVSDPQTCECTAIFFQLSLPDVLFCVQSMAERSHESVLGLGLNPSPREIRLAYLRASLKAHPDHGGSNEEMVAVRRTSHSNIHWATTHFTQVNEAWEALRVSQSAVNTRKTDRTAEEESEYSWNADWSSDAASEYHTDDENFDIDKYYDYGDLDETGGKYKVQLDDGTEISLEEHEKYCGCDCEDIRFCGYTTNDGDNDDSRIDVDTSDDES